MGVMRTVLLKGSESVWLGERAARMGFVKRAVRRFMPGEEVDDALAAARALAPLDIGTILTHLGENVTSLDEVDLVTDHYIDAMDRIRREGLDTQISVKPTQLGLDQSDEACFDHLDRLAASAAALGNFLWIDMESSKYTTATVDLFERLRRKHENVGVCLQAYLRRTFADLERLLPLGPAIRIVKGAYDEPPDIAFADKREVDDQFFRLVERMLAGDRTRGTFAGVATHDRQLIGRVERLVSTDGAGRKGFEFEMLYGIQRDEQIRLAKLGHRIRVLISYGRQWFPWYMRRLAERPANLWFVARNLMG
jgi:proline dehydrogenase